MKCDSTGECSLLTGLGSLLIWADDGSRCGFTLTSPADTSAMVIISSEISETAVDLDLSVPPALTPFPGIDEELIRENNLATKRGDSLRNAYISSWMKDIDVAGLTGQTGIPGEKVLEMMTASMGNYRSIASFISQSGSNASLAMRILENISAKDIRDTPAEVLSDHLVNAPEQAPLSDSSLYDRYVLYMLY